MQKIKELTANVGYLTKSRAPINVFLAYLRHFFDERKYKRVYKQQVREFESLKSDLELSNDWFSGNIPFWLSIFDGYGYKQKPINALEIGSWEGLSSYFILHTLPAAKLTCVDTWQGADEHKDGVAATLDVLKGIEEKFDINLSRFSTRFTKYKGTSQLFFTDFASKNKFDFIYVDGSHYCDDVIIDAIKCFEILNVGGVMVFDDYFWRYYTRVQDNPAVPINIFLRLKKGSYKIIRLYYQLVIEKTCDSDHRLC